MREFVPTYSLNCLTDFQCRDNVAFSRRRRQRTTASNFLNCTVSDPQAPCTQIPLRRSSFMETPLSTQTQLVIMEVSVCLEYCLPRSATSLRVQKFRAFGL